MERRRAPYTPVFLGVTEKSTELDVDRIADEIVTIATQSVSINLPKKWRSTEYQRLQVLTAWFTRLFRLFSLIALFVHSE